MPDGRREAYSGLIVRAIMFSGALHSSGGKGYPSNGGASLISACWKGAQALRGLMF